MKPMTLEWIKLAEGDWSTANREIKVETDTNYKAVSFHAQQCGEKYLKAYIQEKSVNPERTHNLEVLLNKIVPFEPAFSSLRESCVELYCFCSRTSISGNDDLTSGGRRRTHTFRAHSEIRSRIFWFRWLNWKAGYTSRTNRMDLY